MAGCGRKNTLSTNTDRALIIIMLYPQLEERLHHTKHALDKATTENIIERCKQYLALLDEYRSELYKLPDTPGIDLRSGSSSGEDAYNTRKAVRAAIEGLTQEHNNTTSLLQSFTMISGYGAIGTLNRQKYKGHNNWELRPGGVKFNGGTDIEKLTVQEAVDTASLLRRKEHIARTRPKSASVANNALDISVSPE